MGGAATTYGNAGYFKQAATMFRTLGALAYAPATQDEIDGLTAMSLSEIAGSIDAEPLAEGLAGMGACLAQHDASTCQALAAEYERVFSEEDAEGRPLACESRFTTLSGPMMQDARSIVARIYQIWGMAVSESAGMPADHLGFELQFVAALCEKTAQTLEQGASIERVAIAQSGFVEHHILSWLGDLAKLVEERAQSPFYPSLMKVIEGYCHEHLEAVEEAFPLED